MSTPQNADQNASWNKQFCNCIYCLKCDFLYSQSAFKGNLMLFVLCIQHWRPFKNMFSVWDLDLLVTCHLEKSSRYGKPNIRDIYFVLPVHLSVVKLINSFSRTLSLNWNTFSVVFLCVFSATCWRKLELIHRQFPERECRRCVLSSNVCKCIHIHCCQYKLLFE